MRRIAVQRRYSTLLTSPVSMADFVARLAFFAVAPFMIVAAATLFPVWGAIIDVALALSIFLFAPTVRRLTSRHGMLRSAVSHALEFESYYAEKLPRPFWYYAFYPLLFPYWLSNRSARREFLLFRSYTVGALAVLAGSLGWQYYRYWQPEIAFLDILPTILISLVVELLLVLALLMPIATTVVWYHASFRRRRLVVVLLVALASTGLSLWRISSRRDPIVSYSTRQRVRLRSEAAPQRAHDALLNATRLVLARHPSPPSDGKLLGEELDAARHALEGFYKTDETYAFDLWLGPPGPTQVLVLYAPARRKEPALWLALDPSGHELSRLAQLPEGALPAMRQAADGNVPLFPWSGAGNTGKRATRP